MNQRYLDKYYAAAQVLSITNFQSQDTHDMLHCIFLNIERVTPGKSCNRVIFLFKNYLRVITSKILNFYRDSIQIEDPK